MSESTDLVIRLHNAHCNDPDCKASLCPLLRDAAEEVTRLRATILGIVQTIEKDFPKTAAKIMDELNNKTSWNASAATTGGVGHG